MEFIVKAFHELTTQELYKILALRSEVFVVEQDCIYQDVDGKDQRSLHVFGFKNNEIIAYARIFNAGDYFEKPSIGRVVVSKNDRKYGYGHYLIDACIEAVKEYYNETQIIISAQTYLKKFYEAHGFFKVGKEYLEDGIPHIRMDKK